MAGTEVGVRLEPADHLRNQRRDALVQCRSPRHRTTDRNAGRRRRGQAFSAQNISETASYHKNAQRNEDLSDKDGASWAAIASLVETCKLNGVKPQAYVTDLLIRLVNSWSQARIDEPMPWHLATPKSA